MAIIPEPRPEEVPDFAQDKPPLNLDLQESNPDPPSRHVILLSYPLSF